MDVDLCIAMRWLYKNTVWHNTVYDCNYVDIVYLTLASRNTLRYQSTFTPPFYVLPRVTAKGMGELEFEVRKYHKLSEGS